MADWTPTVENPYMRVGNLRALLETLPDDRLIVLAKDAEGNGYSPLSDISDPHATLYVAETTWSGEIFHTDGPPDDPRDDDFVGPGHAQQALVLWPVN